MTHRTIGSELLVALEGAKTALTHSIQEASAAGDWDAAEHLVQWAREVGGMLETVAGVPHPANGRPAFSAVALTASRGSRPANLPFHCTEKNKLVKVGASRDGTTYEHRVTREHFDLIIENLATMAQGADAFETTELNQRCDVPRHEPKIVLDVLEEHHLVRNVRRGRWGFTNASGFATEAQAVWSALPRR